MEAIPWKLASSTNISLWVWETDNFLAKIQTDQHRASFIWEIEDRSTGSVSSLADGFTDSFIHSEEEVREIIGKSYPPNLGYAKYAGHFATTFTIFDGSRIDFGPLQSNKVTLLVRMNNNGKVKEKRMVGRIGIDHYSIKLIPDNGNAIRIPPSRITSIKREFGGAPKPVEREDVVAKNLRIFNGKVEPGCTGKEGFMDNTVEHSPNAPVCPVHEK